MALDELNRDGFECKEWTGLAVVQQHGCGRAHDHKEEGHEEEGLGATGLVIGITDLLKWWRAVDQIKRTVWNERRRSDSAIGGKGGTSASL